MEIYLFRHGIAEDRGAQRFTDDSQRPLTPQGLKRTRKVVEGMAALKLYFDVVLTSPYVRAKQTADILVEVFGIPEQLRLCHKLIPGTKPRELVEEIKRFCSKNDRVALVGHEPDLSLFASLLISGKSDANLTLKKAGLCKLNTSQLVAGRCASLEFLLTPKVLLGLAP